MPPKPDLVFHIAPIAIETAHSAFTVKLSSSEPTQDLSHTNRPSAPIIEEWVSDSEDDSKTIAPHIAHSSVQSTKQVTPPRHSVQPVKAPILAATPKPTSLKTSSSGERKNRKTCFVCRSVHHLIRDCNFHDKPQTQPTPRNYAHRGFNKQHASSSNNYPQKHIVHVAVLTHSKPVSITAVRPIYVDVPKIMNVISKVVCAMCKQCLIYVNHDLCLSNYVNGKTSRGKKQKANVSIKEKQKKQQPKVKKTKKVGFIKRLAIPKPSNPRFFLRWSPTGRLFDLKGKIIASSKSESQSDCSNGDNAYTSNTLEPKIKRFPNITSLLGRNDHVAVIMGFDDLQWANTLITKVYFVKGLVHNLFSVGQFYDSDLEVTFRRNACFIKNLEGVDLLKGDRSINLYTINLHDMASASPIYLMACASSTKSWLWHQRLSHLNFDTINDLAKNNLVSGLSKFKYHKEYLCPSCEQGKSKRASHPPKPVPNPRQRLHLLHMDLCGPMRIASINGKRYVLVFVDDYSCYTWVHFLRSKDKAPEVIKTFLKRINVLLQVYNRRTKKIIETMNVSFDELSVMAFEQRSSKPRLQSMTFGQISSGLDLT
nr:retrovirus-related Pol polyprotein from transposon TNT 1-94 [Tanacetum cinerariifolium]